MKTLSATLLTLALTSTNAIHADDCYNRNDLINYRDLIRQVAVIDEAGRMTEEEYATAKNRPVTEIQNRFAATGKLKCAGGELTAQLTGAPNVITTAGHAIRNRTTCRQTSAPESCTFTVKVGSSERTSRVKRIFATGLSCPDKNQGKDDWAVMIIDPPIEGIRPYDLPDGKDIQENENVVAVSAGAADFLRRDVRTGRQVAVKSIEDCQTRFPYGVTRTTVFESNCDFAQGNSGGSLLRNSGGRDVLLGISTGNTETPAMLQEAERRGTPNKGEYQRENWATFHVPLNTRFLQAVESAMGGRSI